MRLGNIAPAVLLFTLPALAAAPKPVKAELKDGAGKPVGTVTFSQVKKGVRVKVELKDLPMGDHAVHIHQTAACDGPDFKTAGGHFNPDSKHHGFDSPEGHHAGDFPKSVNVSMNKGEQTFTADYLSLDPAAPNTIYGHSVVVHEKVDDQKTDPAGNAGNRIACAVIPAP